MINKQIRKQVSFDFGWNKEGILGEDVKLCS